MPHDIIDNRDQKLADHINRILGSTASARFAVLHVRRFLLTHRFIHRQPL
jgi:hypothetical protein